VQGRGQPTDDSAQGRLHTKVIVGDARCEEGWGKRLMDAIQTWSKERGAEFIEHELREFPDGILGFYEN
jgi:hypothetical protein